MNPRPRPPAPSDLLKEFRDKLGGCWKQDTYCGRHYIKTNKVQQWMRSVQDGQTANNLGRLIKEVWHPRHNRIFAPSAESVSSDDGCAIIVFSVLLAIGHGDLLDLFLDADINDATLSITSAEHHYTSLEKYLRRADVPDPDAVVEAFKKRKWSFLPVIIKEGMHKNYGGESVFPFWKRQQVNDKCGTADVFRVLVPAECIAEDLKQSLQASVVEYNGKEKFYELALKTYGTENRDMFEWEKNAFTDLKDEKGMVRCISHYSFEDEPSWWTHNILLEFGELDLDEFFADEFSSPPVRAREIISFWESLFKIAEALQSIHNLEIHKDGETQEFHGWHADIKPDNILRVHGEFKLVDFGFTKFKEKGNQANPTEYMVGGTQTYGAPETDQRRYETSTAHGQTIDTWSFGCVLSRAATWVILGQQGILQYDFVRKAAIKRLREQVKASQKPKSGCPTAHDAFHNGRTVLPEVIQWHRYLESIVRTSDTITCQVLELAETKMLLENPNSRIKSKRLCQELGDIVLLARAKMDKAKTEQHRFGKSVDESLLTDLYNFDKEAPANEAQANQSKPVKSSKASRRRDKSERLDKISPAKTARREEMLTEELQIRAEPLQDLPQNNSSTILDEPQHESPTPLTPQDDKETVLSLPLSPTPIGGAATNRNTTSGGPSSHATRRDSKLESTRFLEPPPRITFADLFTHPPVAPPLNEDYEIWRVKMQLQQKRNFFTGKHPVDTDLQEFIVDRDMKFVVDNGSSMLRFWSAATCVLETLAMKLAPLDDDRLDLIFTSVPESPTNAKGKQAAREFARCMDKKKPSHPSSPSEEARTDMTNTLEVVFDQSGFRYRIEKYRTYHQVS